LQESVQEFSVPGLKPRSLGDTPVSWRLWHLDCPIPVSAGGGNPSN